MNPENEIKKDPGSFRDPASQVYTKDNMIIREIDSSYVQDYKHFMNSGLYQDLLDREMIIPHHEIVWKDQGLFIQPEKVPFISYPYEWSFRQIQEAAMVTIQTNLVARKYGMMLKDASAYNIQVYKDRMRLIDTTSFMKYEAGMPWHPYTQFLRHFACPMLIIKYDHPNNQKLSRIYLDGIPIQETIHRIPFRKRFKTGIMTHILSQSMNYAVNPKRETHWSTLVFDSLLTNLEKFIGRMEYKAPFTEFTKYADCCGYTPEALVDKKRIVDQCIQTTDGQRFLDLGCNTGTFSIIAQERGKEVIAVDSDHDCIFGLWGVLNDRILPLIVDITNPSPGIGWANRERKPFWDRVGEVDCIMALALVHHLCIRNNVPLGMVADLFADHARNLIIEWVPEHDIQARKLLGNKQIPAYNHDVFMKEFQRRFHIAPGKEIKGAGRIIYQMKRV